MMISIFSPSPGKLVQVTRKQRSTGSVHSLNFLFCVCPEALHGLCVRVDVIGIDKIFAVVDGDVTVSAG